MNATIETINNEIKQCFNDLTNDVKKKILKQVEYESARRMKICFG